MLLLPSSPSTQSQPHAHPQATIVIPLAQPQAHRQAALLIKPVGHRAGTKGTHKCTALHGSTSVPHAHQQAALLTYATTP
jgi:hypothetical protein